MTEMAAHLSGKRLELLKETMPSLARLAVFWNPPNPAYGPVLKGLEAAAPVLRLTLQRLEVRVPEDFEGALKAAVSGSAQARSSCRAILWSPTGPEWSQTSR